MKLTNEDLERVARAAARPAVLRDAPIEPEVVRDLRAQVARMIEPLPLASVGAAAKELWNLYRFHRRDYEGTILPSWTDLEPYKRRRFFAIARGIAAERQRETQLFHEVIERSRQLAFVVSAAESVAIAVAADSYRALHDSLGRLVERVEAYRTWRIPGIQ